MIGMKSVLVAESTAPYGAAVAQTLLRSGLAVRAVTRDLADPVAGRLRLRGARLVWTGGDARDVLDEALREVDAVFAAPPIQEATSGYDTGAALALIEAAARAGVRRFLFASLAPAHAVSGLPHLDGRHEAERFLRSSGMPYAVICPALEMEQLLRPPLAARLREGELPLGATDTHPLQLVARADAARFVRLVVRHFDEFASRRTVIASDELTPIEIAAVLARATQRAVRVTPAVDLPEPWSTAGLALAGAAPRADVVGLRDRYPDVNWHTLDGWARRQDWDADSDSDALY
jgi:uncharacterized protein YbjT (DUF2867 family)